MKTEDVLAEALYSFHSWDMETARSEGHAIAQALDRLGYDVTPKPKPNYVTGRVAYDPLVPESSAEADAALLYNAVVQPDTIWFDDLTPEMQEGWRRGVAALPPLDVELREAAKAVVAAFYSEHQPMHASVAALEAALANLTPETT